MKNNLQKEECVQESGKNYQISFEFGNHKSRTEVERIRVMFQGTKHRKQITKTEERSFFPIYLS